MSKSTHGMSGTQIYAVWSRMHMRCKNPSDRGFKNYGGRGIKVCERWNDFAAFLADMGPRPPGGTLERDEVNGDYEPGNCRWATVKEQQNNRRDNHRLTFRGETKTMSQWAEITGISRHRIDHRIKAGWPVEAALTKPPRQGDRTYQKRPNGGNRSLTHDLVHQIRTAGMTDSYWARQLRVRSHTVRDARVGKTWPEHPTPPDTAARQVGGRSLKAVRRQADSTARHTA